MARPNPVVQFKFQFDPNQERLDNIGQTATMPANHAALVPEFNGMSVHFIEFVVSEWTPYKGGQFIYQGEEVPANNQNPFDFTTAIDFDKALIGEEGEVFLEIPIDDLTPGTYEHLRASVTYQNYSVFFNLWNVGIFPVIEDVQGTIASFVGYNTTINDLQVNQQTIAVNDTKLQGFWAFETAFEGALADYNQVSSGQAPEGATTVVNPFPQSPIPPGSCVVSGSFEEPLVITGDETEDITVVLSFSINNSFEWIDYNGNEEWDLDAENPDNSEPVVDMGLRGLIGKIE